MVNVSILTFYVIFWDYSTLHVNENCLLLHYICKIS